MGEGCNWIVFIFGSAFVVVAAICLLLGWLPAHTANAGFAAGICETAPGKVELNQCRSADCWTCYEACWKAWKGYRVVGMRPVTYYYIATYLDEASAQHAIDYPVNQTAGDCYFQPGGRDIVGQLQDERGPFIAGMVFVALTALIIGLWIGWSCCERYECVCCCRRRRHHYPDENSKLVN